MARIGLMILMSVLLMLSSVAGAETAIYRLTVDNTWSEATHPGLFPVGAHFSWFGGSTHDGSTSFWSAGVETSPGMTQMAENGLTHILMDEMNAAPGTGSTIGWQHWFCPPAGPTWPSCGPTVVEFEIDDAHSFVTLVSMLGPSPDWFVGVSGMPLQGGGEWLNEVVVDLRPYDGGSRSDNVWSLGGPLSVPPDPILLITAGSGQLVGPASLGSLTFTYLGLAPAPAPMLGSVALTALVGALAAVGAFTVRKRTAA